MDQPTIVGVIVLGCFVCMFVFAAVMHSQGAEAAAPPPAGKVAYIPVPLAPPVPGPASAGAAGT